MIPGLVNVMALTTEERPLVDKRNYFFEKVITITEKRKVEMGRRVKGAVFTVHVDDTEIPFDKGDSTNNLVFFRPGQYQYVG